jgi:serine/threonine protein kinase
MTPDRNERIQEIFANALERVEGAERDAYLAEACGADAELRALVGALLRAHRKSAGFMRTLEVEPPDCGEGPGTVIGRYKLLQRIGEGGFGVVYMAEQQEPVRRKVALKIIKLGMDTREVIARFEAERQALALMDHPNIAKVLDGGVTSEISNLRSQISKGRPYFVMELVKGIPLTDYCDQEHLPAAERLQLFIQVCHAVQHAHQKGVIHRDLKPSNILVTLHDGKPVPKIIDFGIAKAISQPLTDKTLFTRFEQMIGTPAYMSPEQAALSGLDVDTRSDIYSLGVLLYELLTGTTPVQRETLHQAALDEVRRMIRETEPPKPSTRLHTLGAKLTEVAQHRHTEPLALQKLVRGDLDWIVMKALEKDRQRRYESAGVFALDIERHLNHEPVTACPPSRMYRARKFVRRHRVGVTMATVVSVAMLVGLALALAGFTQARRERERAKSEAAIAAAVNEFLQEDLLAQADPENEPDRDLKLRTVLDRAAQKIEGRFTNQPVVEAAVRLTLARTYDGLGEYEAAETQAQRAVDLRTEVLGAEHPDTLGALAMLGEACLNRGDSSGSKMQKLLEAEQVFRDLWEKCRRVWGEEHTNTLAALNGLGRGYLCQERYAPAEEILGKLEETYRRVCGPAHPNRLFCLHQLALLYYRCDGDEKSVEMQQRVFEATRDALGPRHPQTLESMHLLALGQSVIGREDEAVRLLERVVSTRSQVIGPNHPKTLESKARLAICYGRAFHWKECAALAKEALGSASGPAKWMYGTNVEPQGLWFAGAMSSLLAGDHSAFHFFASGIHEYFLNHPDGDNAHVVLEVHCASPETSTNWTEYRPLAEMVRTNRSSNSADAMNSVSLGMFEFRCGRYDEALRWFRRAESRYWWGIASQAGYFTAMIHHLRGEPDAAQDALQRANSRFEKYLRWWPRGDWLEYLKAGVTRAEAECLIFGQTRFDSVKPRTFQAHRAAWASVAPFHRRLTEGHRMAAAGEWARAREAYLEAEAELNFDIEVACMTEGHTLPFQLGAVFIRTQDWTNRRGLCQRLAAYVEALPDPDLAFTFAPLYLIVTNGLPPDLVRHAITWARVDPAEIDRFNAAAIPPDDPTVGMAAYRAGELQHALHALESVPDPASVGSADIATTSPMRARWRFWTDPTPVGNATIAAAFRAMCLHELGRKPEAREALRQAESLLLSPLKNSARDHWYRLVFSQAALDEARQLLGQTNVPAAQPVSPR